MSWTFKTVFIADFKCISNLQLCHACSSFYKGKPKGTRKVLWIIITYYKNWNPISWLVCETFPLENFCTNELPYRHCQNNLVALAQPFNFPNYHIFNFVLFQAIKVASVFLLCLLLLGGGCVSMLLSEVNPGIQKVMVVQWLESWEEPV